MVRVGETAPFIAALAERKVHVRDRSKDPTTPGCIRVTTGVLEHTKAAVVRSSLSWPLDLDQGR
jgi:histidinol-phosphate/aromatic aminotransferase/cobyric acid decarboxylase-like protein